MVTITASITGTICGRYVHVPKIERSMERNKTISEDNKKINKALREAFKGTPKYSRYADEEEKSTIDILSCVDSPWEGITSYGTLGLSDYSTGKQVDGVQLG